MNNQGYGQDWQDQYGRPIPPPQNAYKQQQQHSPPQQARQPMVVIPRMSSQDMSQFYPATTPYGHPMPYMHQQHPAQSQPQMQYMNHMPPQSPHSYHPQLQQMHMPQTQIYHSAHQHQLNQYQDFGYPSSAPPQSFAQVPSQFGYQQTHAPPPSSFLPPQQRRVSSQTSPVQNNATYPPDRDFLVSNQAQVPSRKETLPSTDKAPVDRRRSSTTTNNPITAPGKRVSVSPATPSMKPEHSSLQQAPKAAHTQSPASSMPAMIRTPQVVIPAFKEPLQPVSKVSMMPEPEPLIKQVPRPESASSAQSDGLNNPSLDYQVLLLALADQYITTARSLSNSLAWSGDQANLSQYGELMQQGLSCLDSAVNNWKISDPREEARLRLQYANLLFEETENDEEAQAVLSKGITICDRSRLMNQKYSMQHLLARIQFKSSPKAAYKAIDNVLEDLIAYQNTAWIYAFRFLRISLALQRGINADVPSTLLQLRGIISLAESRRDVPVLVMAHVLEASLCIRSISTDSVEQAQRAIAACRSYQFDDSLQAIPQLQALVYLSDLCCDLATSTMDQLDGKSKVLQDFIDQLGGQKKVWLSSGFELPTSVPSTEDLLDQTSGILRNTAEGKTSIHFRWLNRNELFILGFLLSGAARLQKNCLDERAEQYLTEGINYTKNGAVEKRSGTKSLESAASSVARERSLAISLQVLRVFALSIRSNWNPARNLVQEIRKDYSDEAKGPHAQILVYLDGVTSQGIGDLDAALRSYSSPLLTMPASTSKLSRTDLDLRILATMNRAAILRSDPQASSESSALVDAIFPLCQASRNPAMQSAVNLLRTTTTTDLPVIKLKSFLQTSLAAAQKASNHQLISMVMNLMVVRFFSGIVGDQAEKSATVGWQLSRKMKSPLWMSVSGMNLANCYELQGKSVEAQKKMEEVNQCWTKAPELLRNEYGLT